MTGPALLFVLLGLLAAAFLLRPLRAAAYAELSPRRRALIDAGGLAVLGALLIAVRLAPLGLVALVLAGGRVAQGMSGGRVPPGLEDEPTARSGLGRAGMDRAEALSVLGLPDGASDDEIEAAHRKMIVRAHPDQGGSAYLAAKVNEARDVLRRG